MSRHRLTDEQREANEAWQEAYDSHWLTRLRQRKPELRVMSCPRAIRAALGIQNGLTTGELAELVGHYQFTQRDVLRHCETLEAHGEIEHREGRWWLDDS